MLSIFDSERELESLLRVESSTSDEFACGDLHLVLTDRGSQRQADFLRCRLWLALTRAVLSCAGYSRFPWVFVRYRQVFEVTFPVQPCVQMLPPLLLSGGCVVVCGP